MDPLKASRVPKIKGINLSLAWRDRINNLKGCYECSQRRIDCDRTEPVCSKCVGRGLQCSGLGVRYRFRSDVARRKSIIKNGKRRCRQRLCSISDSNVADCGQTAEFEHTKDTVDSATDDGCDCSLTPATEISRLSYLEHDATVTKMGGTCSPPGNAAYSDSVQMLARQVLRQNIISMPSVVLSHSTKPLARFVLHYCKCPDIQFSHADPWQFHATLHRNSFQSMTITMDGDVWCCQSRSMTR